MQEQTAVLILIFKQLALRRSEFYLLNDIYDALFILPERKLFE